MRIRVFPADRSAFWITHPDGGPIPNVSRIVSQRTTVQPEDRGLLISKVTFVTEDSALCEFSPDNDVKAVY